MAGESVRVAVGIDDTDNLESRGTGHRARQLGLHLQELGLARLLSVTQQSPLVSPEIRYTSHNSSACLVMEALSDRFDDLKVRLPHVPGRGRAPGCRRPQLCVARWSQLEQTVGDRSRVRPAGEDGGAEAVDAGGGRRHGSLRGHETGDRPASLAPSRSRTSASVATTGGSAAAGAARADSGESSTPTQRSARPRRPRGHLGGSRAQRRLVQKNTGNGCGLYFWMVSPFILSNKPAQRVEVKVNRTGRFFQRTASSSSLPSRVGVSGGAAVCRVRRRARSPRWHCSSPVGCSWSCFTAPCACPWVCPAVTASSGWPSSVIVRCASSLPHGGERLHGGSGRPVRRAHVRSRGRPLHLDRLPGAGLVVDASWRVLPKSKARVWVTALLLLPVMTFAHMTKPIIRCIISLIAGWPYGSFRYGVGYPVLHHALFGLAGGVMGVSCSTAARPPAAASR